MDPHAPLYATQHVYCYLLLSSTAASSALPPLSKAKAAFLAEHGSSYGYNGWIDAHWQEEVGVRLPDDQHYLDFTGMWQLNNVLSSWRA